MVCCTGYCAAEAQFTAYLEVARREAGSQYRSRPTQFILGDFAVFAGTLPDADVVTAKKEAVTRAGISTFIGSDQNP
jgi:hypothetical protein